MDVNDAGAFPDDSIHERYASFLAWGSRLSLAFLVAAFAAYLCEILPSHVEPASLSLYWGYPLDTFLERTGTPVGWKWLEHAGYGELASLTGIAMLASCSVPCLLAVFWLFLRKRNRIFASLCIMQVVIMTLAASGTLG